MRNKKVKVGEVFYNRTTDNRYQITSIDRTNQIYLKEYGSNKKELFMYPYKSFIENFIPERVSNNDIVAGYSMGKLRYVNIVEEVKRHDSCFRFKKTDGSTVTLTTWITPSGVLSQLGKRDDVEYRLVWGKERDLLERRQKYNRVLSNLNELKNIVAKNNGNNIIQDKYKLNKIDKELKILLKILKET